LAKLSAISQTYIYRIERGEIKNPRRDTLQTLAKGLGISLAELIGETAPLDTWGLVELSLKAYIPVYAEIGGTMGPIDYVVCTRAEVPAKTLCAYRISSLCLEPEIHCGDTIVVDTALVPVDGDIVVALAGGQPSLKRYRQNGQATGWLEDNAGWCEVEGVSVHGVVTELVHKLR
jgi:transcriptional regulator with XRE-family HTH domain